jgi:hypothetical protein
MCSPGLGPYQSINTGTEPQHCFLVSLYMIPDCVWLGHRAVLHTGEHRVPAAEPRHRVHEEGGESAPGGAAPGSGVPARDHPAQATRHM